MTVPKARTSAIKRQITWEAYCSKIVKDFMEKEKIIQIKFKTERKDIDILAFLKIDFWRVATILF